MNFFDEINGLEYLFFLGLEEPRENQIIISVKQASIANREEDLIIGTKNIGPVRSINNENGQEYEVFFSSYAAYTVFNESYAIYSEDIIRVGRLFCIYPESDYLDYIRKATFIEAVLEKEQLKHYEINCLNHSISIATMAEPIIKKL